ncbi:MAG TPA: DUF4383 domain-containing protein [Solirubrobacterales bacterium]|jgi:hypothetical protein|nr:DUF4383 domain-containing protein [Solirubrobacterales bacterium]
MEPANPARLYATAVGALLVVLGIVGFFYGSSFGSPGTLDHTLGALRTNGWLNLLWALVGALGLLLAGTASRAYALGAGLLFTVLGVWGLALDSNGAILSFIPAESANEALQLTLGLLGLLAFAGTPRSAVGTPRGDPKGASRAAPERTSPLL